MNRISRNRAWLGTTMLATVLAMSGARPAHALYADVATSGVIAAGTDTSGLFGAAGRNLAGLAYTMDLVFDSPGSFTFSSASDATTSGSATGSVTIRIGGPPFTPPFTTTFTTAFTDSFGSFLEQTPHEITASNIGDDTGANFLSVTNQFSTATALLPVNLGAPFSYAGSPADIAANAGAPVTFSVSGATENASFSATPGSVTYTVPEPASLGLLAAGLAVAGLVRRRARVRAAPAPAGTGVRS